MANRPRLSPAEMNRIAGGTPDSHINTLTADIIAARTPATTQDRQFGHIHDYEYKGTAIDRKGAYDEMKCRGSECGHVTKDRPYSGFSTATERVGK